MVLCLNKSQKEPIAIVGSACHFAGGVDSPSKLWDLLQAPRDVRSEIRESRFSAAGFYHPDPSQHGHHNVTKSYFIDGEANAFDAEFFGIKPVEAQAIDPQQKMLMETVYEAIESAGMTIDGLRTSDTAVFVGSMCADFEALQLRDMNSIPTYSATGTARSILANRISYFFDWHGPSMTIDTACSSSLVAVHQAVQVLRSGESRMAVACGSNLILGPENYITESKLHMLSPDGVGRMWDESANGYARGEGVAAVVLKPLSVAIADGDHVECLIRETGVNQDGATAGITMPSASGQQALIEATYAKAGLDLKLRADRPQMFEAHGTGTPAGDPIEAEAISKAFYGDEKGHFGASDCIHVGSIKTILGHTEGTAGIAAVLRASLAIQHGQIPPNLHLKNLNPSILPYYHHLNIPQTLTSWPEAPAGSPRRSSVNSFGFGGTNAHAILESYDATSTDTESSQVLFTPYVFSARSETSLRAYLLKFAAYLQRNHSSIDPQDLAFTLRQRRNLFPYRIAYTAQSLESLRDQILSSLSDKESKVGVHALGLRSAEDRPQRIFGIFTGQGAQYPRMGAALVETSPMADRIIQTLEACLAQLPETDRPRWSLRAELLASSTTSRVHEAAISQPLCTAVQILLVDLLRTANIYFDAVVGHSSGEIGAAYAAGYLNARDAMIIAYYRGVACEQAESRNGRGIEGAMLAIGTSMEDALSLCEDELFAGRISVAACNSSASVTISGDADAIEELEVVLDDEAKFNRRLRVDKAYHSPHMQPCAEVYKQYLRRAGIQFQRPSKGCRWYSSLHNGQLMDADTNVDHAYWADNMVKPVLFHQALLAASSGDEQPDVVLEVGAHPALKGPASQTMQNLLGIDIPYLGSLDRKIGAVEAVSNCMGFLWSAQAKKSNFLSIDLNAYEVAVSDNAKAFSVIKGLPSYQWNHSINYGHESRTSQKIRLRGPFHPLLGHETPNSSPHHRSWRNILKASEIDWLEGHRVQGQLVFPAAGYIVTLLEAARTLSVGREILLIEISDFLIQQAITFDTRTSAVEVLIDLFDMSELSTASSIDSRFTYRAALESQTGELSIVANGRVRVVLGASSRDILPQRRPKPPHLLDLEPERLYGAMDGLGYNFSSTFRSLRGLQRKHGKACCRLPVQYPESPFLLHPVDVDAALQSIMLAYSYPGDGQLRTLHLPTSLKRLRVNPALCVSKGASREDFALDSTCGREERQAPGRPGFTGQANIYTSQTSHAVLQAEGVHFMPIAETNSATNDRNVFYKMDWVPSTVDGVAAAAGIAALSSEDTKFLIVFSRVVSYYLRKFDNEVPADSPVRAQPPLCYYLDYAHQMTEALRRGELKLAKKEWLADTAEDVHRDIQTHGFSGRIEIKLALLIGETMPRVFNQETSMIEHMRASNLLDDYYSKGFGMRQSSIWLSQALKQVTDRNPHLKILEVGAGTGGATKDILSSIGRNFDTYTFTDVSSGFFGDMTEPLGRWNDKMIFKVLDAEGSPAEQGFDEGTYDVIVSSFVIHATAKLADTMRNLRKLLKPGGYLVVGEGTSDGPLSSGDGFLFGPLPGWWRGVDEGRTLTPLINLDQWDALLKETGFSGIDARIPQDLSDSFGLAAFVSQAINGQISLLREPLTAIGRLDGLDKSVNKLAIIGGLTEPVQNIVHALSAIMTPFFSEVVYYLTLDGTDFASLSETTPVICLTELDILTFKDLTRERWNNLKQLFETSKRLLWVSTGRLDDQPWSNMPVGLGRTALNEIPDLQAQFLDFPSITSICPRTIAEYVLRLMATNNDLSIDNDVLWTMEPEVVIDVAKRHLVPRLTSIATANARYNSAQRSISHQIQAGISTLELRQNADACTIREVSKHSFAPQLGAPTKLIKLRTMFSLLSAIKTSVGHQFLASGLDAEGRRYMCLVPRLCSILEIPETNAIPYQVPQGDHNEDDVLTAVAAHMVALLVLEPVLPGQKVALHNASSIIVQAVDWQASRKGVSAYHYFTTTSKPEDNNDAPKSDSSIVLPPYASYSELLEKFPASQFTSFASLSKSDDHSQRANEETMLSTLSRHCHRETAESLYAESDNDVGESSSPQLRGILEQCIMFAQEFTSGPSQPQYKAERIELGALINNKQRPKNPMTIIDWTSPKPILAEVRRLDANLLFSGDKTYWLCGMSGALGISLCDWMIDRGVRYLVVTSRNPKIEQAWLDTHRLNGVDVRTFSCDITDEQALRGVHSGILQTMPPIAGVLNGAMVLRDSSIPNMQYDDVMDVINPKVLGSIHLDRIFYDVPLDFFVLVSSITCVVGNVGQANYSAANMYMCALAANRRKRGLNAVALNGGAIIGAGYITRETDRALDLTVEKMNLMRLSEEDFHQMIAEAIESGYADSAENGAEITTGLETLDINGTEDLTLMNVPKWYRNPRLSHFVVKRGSSTVLKDHGGQQIAIASIEDQLRGCKTTHDLFTLVQTSFCIQLRKLLLLSIEVMSDQDMLAKRSVELGVDSLISVDLRSWFMKTFKVNVPVLKIMGNDIMASLVSIVVESLSAETGMAPLLVDGVSTVSEGDTSREPSSPSEISPTSTHTSYQNITSSSIDWEAESTPPADLAGLICPEPSSLPPPRTPAKVIVITGVTGHLGHHLLEALQNSEAEEIHCLATRRLQDRLQSNSLPFAHDPRVLYHDGDLADPYLGLSEDAAKALFARADAVIHNGADTSHAKPYQALRATNVGSTHALIRLCLPRRVPMHYISSAGVGIYYNENTFPAVSVTTRTDTTGGGINYPSDKNGAFGYACSKWVNERFLERVRDEYCSDLPICIYRPSTIIRQGVDADNSQAELDWVNALLQYTRQIGAAPMVQHNRGALDLVQTETCCIGVLERLFASEGASVSAATIEYVNLVGDVVIPLDDLGKMSTGQGEQQEIYTVLPLDEWITKAIEAGLHPGVAQLIREMDAPDRPDYPRLSKFAA